MNKSRILHSILAISFGILAIPLGVFAIVYGEFDDSPGGQVLGLVLVIAGIVSIVKARRKILSKNSI